jgi:hypothetical protein
MQPGTGLLASLSLSVVATMLTATLTTGTATARTGGNASASLDQCANGPLTAPNLPACAPSQWANGNLGASSYHYFEGDSIPYRLTLDNLSFSSHAVTIEWDTTKTGMPALDYLTTFNRSVPTADPCADVTGCAGPPSTVPIPPDPQVTAAGVTPVAGDFALYGGTITAVSAYSYRHGTGFAGGKSARATITFTPNRTNPVLAWGGHISARPERGDTNAAVPIIGSPYHMRLMGLDGSGGATLDRSLPADAVIFPASITIIDEASRKGR